MEIKEQAAYLKGLFDGYGFDRNEKETKLIGQMLDLLGTMAEKIDALEADNAELREYIEEVDQDLGAVEDDFYLDNGDDEDEGPDAEDGDNTGYYEVVCPNCGETVCFDESLDPNEIVCPACGEKINDIELCDGECETCENKLCEEE